MDGRTDGRTDGVGGGRGGREIGGGREGGTGTWWVGGGGGEEEGEGAQVREGGREREDSVTHFQSLYIVCGMSVHRMCMTDSIIPCDCWLQRRRRGSSSEEGECHSGCVQHIYMYLAPLLWELATAGTACVAKM